MIRDVTLTKTVERIEALVTTLWVLSDFVIFTLLLCTASHIFRLIFGFRPEMGDVRSLDMSNGRAVIPLCAALSGTAALLMPTSEHVMRRISPADRALRKPHHPIFHFAVAASHSEAAHAARRSVIAPIWCRKFGHEFFFVLY